MCSCRLQAIYKTFSLEVEGEGGGRDKFLTCSVKVSIFFDNSEIVCIIQCSAPNLTVTGFIPCSFDKKEWFV